MCFSGNIPGSDERVAEKVHSIIRSFVERGEIKRERIDASYQRVIALKKNLNRKDLEILQAQVAVLQKEEARLRKKLAETEAAQVKESQEPEKKKKKKKRS